jgi:hypothetical protein
MGNQRRGGIIQVQANGVIYDVVGDFTTGHGYPKREALMGSDGKNHGYKETPQVAFIEGQGRDSGGLDLGQLFRLEGATVTMQKANGKVFVLRNAYYAGDGTSSTEESTFPLRFEGDSPAEEVT